MASFPGKQFPMSSMADNSRNQARPTTAPQPPPLFDWRMRDMAEHMLNYRREAFSSGGGGGDGGGTSSGGGSSMYQSSTYDTDTCLARIRRDKAAIVRNAFNAAGTAVLEGLKKQQDDDDVIEHQDPSSLSTDPSKVLGLDDPSLPAAMSALMKLEKLREASLERSHENKEYSKRKGAKTDVASATKLTSPEGGSGGGAGFTGGKPGSGRADNASKATKKVKTCAAAASDAPGGATATAAGGGAPTTKRGASSSSSSGGAATPDGPKFTRNTPASSAAALDYRFNSSRAILCAAGNIAFDALTPPIAGHEIDVLDVPQNPANKRCISCDEKNSGAAKKAEDSSTAVNMGAVVVEAQTLGQRTISVAQNAARRSLLRYNYRRANARYNQKDSDRGFLQVENPFAWKDDDSTEEEDNDDDDNTETSSSGPLEDGPVPYQPSEWALTDAWSSLCLPRLMSVIKKGAGHALYHDVQWSTRHGRIADLFRSLARDDDNFGPHLIVTTEPEVTRFAQEFHDVNSHLRLITTNVTKRLQTLPYNGSKKRRRRLRRFFSTTTGLPEASVHVIVSSYAAFLEDYLHFCQLPFEVVLLDDGVSWMAAAQGDQNSAIGSIWDSGIWSSSDHQTGLAGTTFKEWDFKRDSIPESAIKEAWVGLTTRHRILTSSALRIHQRSVEVVPVSGLVRFVLPHFAETTREEWDRSRISADGGSMDHFQQLVARSTVVHSSEAGESDMYKLAMRALKGELTSHDRSEDPEVPMVISDDTFISKGMVAFSRRSSLAWLGPQLQSWLRYELGSAKLQSILDAMKICNNHGHFCEEIATASSTTSSGATGQVTGTMAFRLAIRCGRHFGSEQGLRQHVSALHAPPGTWLCRTCATDCISSQARTHHERSCGQPASGTTGDSGVSVGATPTVGQGAAGKGGVGKKKSGRTGSSQQGAATVEEKDADGSFRVPGYRGVWVNKAGKHFIKIEGKCLTETVGGEDVILFDSIDEAAKKHDEVVQKEKKKNQKVELNFKPDGSRIVYEDITPASTSGLGGSAANVVPALSVINIKDLPADVKPLLRDPRQTSRTGGNSKRHVYAYRGVCRQARKGHDRWQSQISFMGVNHYLGTFDSEWDAAAIYAWAHLILYGEEATRQAQKEGEEAAAAYEQEKRDIAAGKILEPPPKSEKKKKKPNKKSGDQTEKGVSTPGDEDKASASLDGGERSSEKPKKRKALPKDSPGNEKKAKTGARTAKVDKESIGPTLAKGVAKAPILAPREAYEMTSDAQLVSSVAVKLSAARDNGYSFCDSHVASLAPVGEFLRPCIPVSAFRSGGPPSGAMLLGLSPSAFEWDLQDFVESTVLDSDLDSMTAIQMLAVEYDEDGTNENFRCVIQGTACVIGNASKTTRRMYEVLGLGSVPMGGSVGRLDCHVGGVPGSCSEMAAYIRFAPTTASEFQFACISDEDIVTLNGQRVMPESGCFPLFNEDICTVGARVFVFLLPTSK